MKKLASLQRPGRAIYDAPPVAGHGCGRWGRALAFLVLGLIFIFNGTLWCLGVAAFAARTARHVRQSGRAMRWINRALGGMFVYLGARIALLEAR